jgi:hypothetical protein
MPLFEAERMHSASFLIPLKKPSGLSPRGRGAQGAPAFQGQASKNG